MNNNQFKRFIREKIEAACKENEIEVIYIDTTANERVYYFYDKNYNPLLTASVWLNNTEYHISTSIDKNKPVNIVNKTVETWGNFLQIKDLISFIRKFIVQECILQRR